MTAVLRLDQERDFFTKAGLIAYDRKILNSESTDYHHNASATEDHC